MAKRLHRKVATKHAKPAAMAAVARKAAVQDFADDTGRLVAENVAIAYQARSTTESRAWWISAT